MAVSIDIIAFLIAIGIFLFRKAVSQLLGSTTACESKSQDFKCDTIEAKVDVYYNGKKASQDEKDEMLALLIDIIEDQEASGSFSEAGSVQSVVATSSKGNRDTPNGLPVGVVVGALAVLGVAGGYYYKSRKRSLIVNGGPIPSDKEDNHNTDDSSNEGEVRRSQEPIEVHATLIDYVNDHLSAEKKK